MHYTLGASDVTMDAARVLQSELRVLYDEANDPGLSWSEQRSLDKAITAKECELSKLLDNQAQASTPGGLYTPEGVKDVTGSVIVNQPALVLGAENVDEKKRWPWLLAILAAGTATYFTVKG